jgi:antitoxin VapB
MAFHVRNRDTERLVRELAHREKIGLTEAVHIAVSNELHRRGEQPRLWEKTAAIRRRVTARVKNPRPVPKAFLDDLYADGD